LPIALAAVLLSPATGWPQQLNAQYHDNVRHWAQQLAQDIQALMEDISIELPRREQRELYRRADRTLQAVRHFRQSLRAGVGRDHIYRDFNDMDREVHGLLEAMRDVDKDERALRRAASRINYADQQLHYAISHGDTSEGRRREVVERQARALATEATELYQTARYVLPDGPRGRHIEEMMRQFMDEANLFHRKMQERNEGWLVPVRAYFEKVDKDWYRVARDLGALTARENAYLRNRIERVELIMAQLYQRLDVPGTRQPIFPG
jgi:hypothetical protein